MPLLIIGPKDTRTAALVATATDAGETLALLHRPDQLPRISIPPRAALILDGPAPFDPARICQDIRLLGHQWPVLVLIGKNDAARRIQVLDAGADMVLSGDVAYPEIRAHLAALLRRATLPASVRLQLADLVIDSGSRSVWRDRQAITLAPREFALLEFLMRNPGRVFSEQQVLKAVWHSTAESNTNVLQVCIRRLRQKVDTGFSLQLIHTVRGQGYTISDTLPPGASLTSHPRSPQALLAAS